MIDRSIYHIDMLLYLLQESTGSTLPIKELNSIIEDARIHLDKLIRDIE